MMNNPSAVRPDSYDPQFFPKIIQVEKKHFWFAARNRIIAEVISSIIGEWVGGYRVLEVGCGTGIVLGELVKICRSGQVIGMDLYPEAVALAGKRAGCQVVVGDLLNPPPLGQFDLLGIFDVLEHMPNDREIVSGLNRLLKPGGVLVVTGPAHMSLWSYFDVAACHRRRYEMEGLTSILREGGIEIEYATEFMMSLFPLVWFFRRLNGGDGRMNRERAAGKASAELKVVPVVNSILKLMLRPEVLAVRQRRRLPFGTSLLAVGRKLRAAEDKEPVITTARDAIAGAP